MIYVTDNKEPIQDLEKEINRNYIVDPLKSYLWRYFNEGKEVRAFSADEFDKMRHNPIKEFIQSYFIKGHDLNHVDYLFNIKREQGIDLFLVGEGRGKDQKTLGLVPIFTELKGDPSTFGYCGTDFIDDVRTYCAQDKRILTKLLRGTRTFARVLDYLDDMYTPPAKCKSVFIMQDSQWYSDNKRFKIDIDSLVRGAKAFQLWVAYKTTKESELAEKFWKASKKEFKTKKYASDILAHLMEKGIVD